MSIQNYSGKPEIAALTACREEVKENTEAYARDRRKRPSVQFFLGSFGGLTLKMQRSDPKVTKPLKLSQMIDINRIDILVSEGLVQRPISGEYQTPVRCDVNDARICQT